MNFCDFFNCIPIFQDCVTGTISIVWEPSCIWSNPEGYWWKYLYQTATNHSKARTVCHIFPLQWRHNGLDGVSNHQPHHCLLNHLFWRRSKKTSKLRVTGLWREFPAQMASNAENVSIWWRHHVRMYSAKWMRFENYNIIHELLLHISIKVSSDLIWSYRWHARLIPIAQNPASYKFHGKLGNLWKPHCSSWWISP